MKSFFSKKIVVGALVTATVCVSGITDAKAQEFAVTSLQKILAMYF